MTEFLIAFKAVTSTIATVIAEFARLVRRSVGGPGTSLEASDVRRRAHNALASVESESNRLRVRRTGRVGVASTSGGGGGGEKGCPGRAPFPSLARVRLRGSPRTLPFCHYLRDSLLRPLFATTFSKCYRSHILLAILDNVANSPSGERSLRCCRCARREVAP